MPSLSSLPSVQSGSGLDGLLADPRWDGLSRVQKAEARTRLFTTWLDANPAQKDQFLAADEAQRSTLFGEFVDRVQKKYPDKFTTSIATGRLNLRTGPRPASLADAGTEQRTAVADIPAAEETARIPILDPESERKLAAVGEAGRTKRGTGFENWTAQDFTRLGPLVDALHPQAASIARVEAKPKLAARAKEIGEPVEGVVGTAAREAIQGATGPGVRLMDAVAGVSEKERHARELAQGMDWLQGDVGFEQAGAVGALVAGGTGAARALGTRLLTRGGIATLAAADAGLGAAYAQSAPGYLAHKVEQWTGEQNETRTQILTALEAAGISGLAGVGMRQLTINRLKDFARTQGWRGATNAELRTWYFDQLASRAKTATPDSASAALPSGPAATVPEAPGAANVPAAGAESTFLRRAGVPETRPATNPAEAIAAGRAVDSGPPVSDIPPPDTTATHEGKATGAPPAANPLASAEGQGASPVSAETAGDAAPAAPLADRRNVQPWELPFDPADPSAVAAKWGEGVDVPFARLNEVRAVELPELVALTKQWTGAAPKVMKLAQAYGGFVPVGNGAIKLDYRVFAQPALAARVLAHEIGHLVDYLPDKSMARGNLLGRLGSLRDYLKGTLDVSRVSPSRALTDKDRAALRRQSRKAVEQRLGPRPDPITHRAEYNAWIEDWHAAHRMLVDDTLATRKLTRADVVREELINLSEWWKPYQDLADAGRVPDSYVAYRESGPELYADMLSVLFNAPGKLAEMAPEAWRLFWNHLDAKPEVKAALFELQELLAGPVDAKLARRRAELRAGFARGDEVFLRAAAEREAAARSWRGWLGAVQRELVDVLAPVSLPARKLAQSGNARAQATEWLMDEHPLAMETSNYRLMQQMYEQVVQPLQAAGLSTTDLGEALFLNRVAFERIEQVDDVGQVTNVSGRSVLANTGGQTPETARQQLAYLEQVHGPARWAALQGAVNRFHELVWGVVQEAVDVGTYNRETFDTVIAPNKGRYATFAAVDYLQDFIPAGIRQQRGTLSDVANPFLATLLKVTALNKLNQLQRAKRGVVEFMQDFFPGEIAPAKTRFDGRREVPVPNPAHDGGTFELLEDGRVAGYYVNRDVAEMFDGITPARASAIIRGLNWTFRKIFYPAIITYNPVFQLALGPLRDLRRGIRNVPRGRGLRQAGEVLANLGTIMVEAANAAARGGGLTRLGLPQIPVPMTETARSVRHLLRGQGDPVISDMLQHSAIASPIDTFSAGPDGERALAKLLERFRLLPDQNREEFWKKWFLAPVYQLLRGIEFAGLTMEYLPKVGTWRQMIQAPGADAREVAAFVRNHVGVPNFRRAGKHTRIAGTLFPFFNVMVQGFRDDLRLATGKKSAAGWWLRYMAGSGLARVMQALAAAGLLGAGLKEFYDYVSSYDQTNYTVIPLGWNDGGDFGKRALVLRIPEDETDRLLGGLIHLAITRAAGEGKGAVTDLAGFAGGQLPSLNPAIELAGGWGQWLAGRNPIDTFRGNPVLSDAEFKAGGWESFKGMASWSYEQTGVQNFVRWDPQAQTWAEATMSATPGVNRLFKVTDYGMRERQRSAEAANDKVRAQVRLHLPAEVQALYGEHSFLTSIKVENLTPAQQARRSELQTWYAKIYKPSEENLLLARELGLSADYVARAERDLATASEGFGRR